MSKHTTSWMRGAGVVVAVMMVAACLAWATGAKAQVVDVGSTAFPGAVVAADNVPMNSAPSGNFFTMWTPTQLGSTTGTILEFGFMYRTAFAPKTWSNVKIWMGGTQRTSGISITINAPTPVFLDNFHASAQPVLVYDGTLTLSAATTGMYVRTPLQTPYAYAGGNMSLAVYMEILGGSATPSSATASYATSVISPSTISNFRVHNTTTIATSGTLNNSTGHAASFLFGSPANPGIVVARGGVTKANNGTDDLGTAPVANALTPLTYTITNPGISQNLTISSIAVSNLSNCVASVVAPAPTSAPFGGTPVPFVVNVTPGSGTFGFRLTILSNASVVADQTYIVTATGWGAGNTAPSVQAPTAPPGGQVTGTYPNYMVETLLGNSLAFTFSASDANVMQPLTFTVAQGSGGTISPSVAGFSTVFPASATSGTSPRSVALAGTAAAVGTVVLTASAVDNGAPALSDQITVTVKIGARMDAVSAVAQSPYFRANGRKDVYRGQSAVPVNVVLANPNTFAVSVQSLSLQVVPAAGGAAVTGISFSVPGLPLTIPPSNLAFPVAATMDVASNASGTNGLATRLSFASVTAIDPANPTTNPVVVVLPSTFDEFDLRDGPAPVPLAISTTSLAAGIEGSSYLQSLVIAGGSGSYVWSVPSSSAAQLPGGLTLNAQGSTFLPANISGTPNGGTSVQSPYVITFNVTDGTHVAATTLTLTVSFIPPLVLVNSSLPSGTEYLLYSMPTPLTATGGQPPYAFSVDAGSSVPLPSGLTLDQQTGVISGIPANGTVGTHSILFAVADGIQVVTKTLSITIAAHPLQWRTTTVPQGKRTVPYNHQLDAIGGTGPRTYSIQSGILPPGLSLSPFGVLSGRPEVIGTYGMQFKVTDGTNTSVNASMNVVVVQPDPLVFTTTNLPNARVGVPFNGLITGTGGSTELCFLVPTGEVLPQGLTLDQSGFLLGTPTHASEGAWELSIDLHDGFITVNRVFHMAVLGPNSMDVRVSEIDVGTGYIEIANTGSEPVDVSAWQFRVWVGASNAPLGLVFDTLPAASAMVSGSVVTLSMGGTAGGAWPAFNSGTAWTANAQSSVAVQLLDSHGSTVDFVRIGTVNVASLVDGFSSPLRPSDVLLQSVPLASGALNHSLATSGFVASPAGSQGVYNVGLPTKPLGFAKSRLRAAAAGTSYVDWIVGQGGRAPYSYSIDSPTAPWLSVNASTGEITGSVPPTASGLYAVQVNVSDATQAMVGFTEFVVVSASTAAPAATLTLASMVVAGGVGEVTAMPVTMTLAGSPVTGASFSFEMVLPASTAPILEVLRVAPGTAAISAGLGVTARTVGVNRVLVSSHGTATAALAAGEVAVVYVRVLSTSGTSTVPLNYDITMAHAGVKSGSQGVLTSAVSGVATIQHFKPQDVNRDGAIDVVDVQLTVNIILQLFIPVYPGQGSMTGGPVSVVDVQTIVNCILSGGC